MEACSEATQLITSLTAQVAQLKQMSSVEHIQRNQIIEAGEDILKAWMKGQPHDELLHAKWHQATDQKLVEKKFKAIQKEYEAKMAELENAKSVIAEHKKEEKKKNK